MQILMEWPPWIIMANLMGYILNIELYHFYILENITKMRRINAKLHNRFGLFQDKTNLDHRTSE